MKNVPSGLMSPGHSTLGQLLGAKDTKQNNLLSVRGPVKSA